MRRPHSTCGSHLQTVGRCLLLSVAVAGSGVAVSPQVVQRIKRLALRIDPAEVFAERARGAALLQQSAGGRSSAVTMPPVFTMSYTP
jgi:hypothetical protein